MNQTKSTKEETKQSNIILIIILATIFGLGSGATSIFIFKPFVLNELYNTPLSGEINLSQDKIRRANLVIENAKKIIIEQDNRVEGVIGSAKKSMAGVYKKKNFVQDKEHFNINNYYKLNNKIAEGIIITSDGWILVNNFTETINKKDIAKNFVIITNDNELYTIDDVIKSKVSSYLFVHLKNAKELPVKSFSEKKNLTNGQLVVVTDMDENSYLTSIINKNDKQKEVLSSDEITGNFILSSNVNNYFNNSFIFNLNSDIIGLFNKKNGVIAIDNFQPRIKALLNKKTIAKSNFGVNYISLSNYAINDTKYKDGALVQKITIGGTAEAIGLKKNDIIISVNNIRINKTNNLSNIIQKYLPGDEITILYIRDGKEKIAKNVLKKYEPIN